MNFTPGSPGSSGADPAGFLLSLDGEANKVPRNGFYWFCAKVGGGIHSHKSFKPHHLLLKSGKGFPECRNCKTTSNKWKISNLCSLTLPQTLRHHCGLLDTQSSPALEAPSLCLLEKGNKTVTAHQNLRAAAAPGAIRHCQGLPGVDIH